MIGLRKKTIAFVHLVLLSPDRRGILGDERRAAWRRTLRSQESRGTALKGQKK